MAGLARVLPDANVLYSRTLRDWLVMLSGNRSMYVVCWTEDILAELHHSLRHDNPTLHDNEISGVVKRIRATFSSGEISGYQPKVSGLTRDKHDEHVVAAACHGNVHYLVTSDKKFAESDDTEYEIYTPDDFFVLIDDSNPGLVREVTSDQLQYWMRRKNGESFSLPGSLQRSNAPKFAERVRRHLMAMS